MPLAAVGGIFGLSTTTTVFGLIPLVLMPGAGSELYRGLGAVVLGGLVVSTVFTLFLVPTMFSLMLDTRESLARRLFGEPVEEAVAPPPPRVAQPRPHPAEKEPVS